MRTLTVAGTALTALAVAWYIRRCARRQSTALPPQPCATVSSADDTPGAVAAPVASTAAPAASPVSSAPHSSTANTASTAAAGDQCTSPASAGAFAVGQRVRLEGIKSQAELNQQRGTVIGVDLAKDRVQVQLGGERRVQLKPACVVAIALDQISAEELTPVEMCQATFSVGHGSFTPAHAERVTQLMQQLRHDETRYAEMAFLVRACCCVEWHVPCLKPTGAKGKRSAASAAARREFLAFEQAGAPPLIACCSAEGGVKLLQALNPAPAGKAHLSRAFTGRALFNPVTLGSVEAPKFAAVILNPRLAEGATASSEFTQLPAQMFAALCHMSEAVYVESHLAAVVAWATGPAAADEFTEDENLIAGCEALASHTFFCFNAATAEQSARGEILPMNATGQRTAESAPAPFMILYTCEMALQLARPQLTAAGALRPPPGVAEVGSSAVLFAQVLETLSGEAAQNRGVILNDFVPGIAPELQAKCLPTAALVRIAAVASRRAAGATGTVV